MQSAVNCPEDPSLNRTPVSGISTVEDSSVPGLDSPVSLDREVVTTREDFKNLAVEWAALGVRSRSACVFMQWEWHYTWWQVYAGRRDTLHIITWRCRGELVGLLPLYRKAATLIPGNACLLLIGTGESASDEVATEYGDVLADDQLESEIGALAADYLQQFRAWTRVRFYCMLEDSVLYPALRAAQDGHVLSRSSGLRYRLRLPDDEITYLDNLGGSRAKRIRRSQRAALREGGFKATAVDSVDGFDQAFHELGELNHERQAHMRRKSVFASPRFRQFHQILCNRLHDTGAADIVRFHIGARLLAVLYCFYDTDTCHYYQSGFTRKDSNRFMPLTLAHLMEMQRSRDAGKRYYDFMRGEPPTYKEEFDCETSALVNVAVYRWCWQRVVAVAYRHLRATAARGVRAVLRR